MKTNTLLVLLLAAMVAVMTGCQADWKSQIGGIYKTTIYNGADEYAAKTTFKNEGGKISGEYELDVFGTEHVGVLRKFSAVGGRKLKCQWHDDMDRTGYFSMTFSQDMSSFKGQWDADDGDGDGAWNGKKQ